MQFVDPLFVPLLVGLALSSLIGVIAYRRGSLSQSGVLGAILTGTIIFGFGGPVPGLLLIAFFVSSSFFSHYKAQAKADVTAQFQKSSQRDLGQALANAGWASLLALFSWNIANSDGNPQTELLALIAIIGAFAAVTADTWATEIGVLSKRAPRMITSGRIVPAGTSGGITPLGTLTALGGGIFIGVMVLVGALILYALHVLPGLPFQPDTYVLSRAVQPYAGWLVILIAGLSGLGGSLFDSLLGATVQAIYFCEYDEVQTEQKVHSCGRTCRQVRGWSWLDNDLVNLTSSIVGSGIAVALAWLLLR